MVLAPTGLNPKFNEYATGFSEVYIEHYKERPVMGVLVYNGWLDVKDKKLIDFYKTGKEHARSFIKRAEIKPF